jgi:HD-GYP domain-containing protein (c-di-GMP phosphodiesterase class II)
MTTAKAKTLAGDMVASGYSAIVLDRLAGQASQILAADQSWIFVRDPSDSCATIVAAVRGVDQRLVGKRLPLDAERLGGAAGAAVATLEHDGEVRGSLAVRRLEPSRRFQSGELEILAGLGEIAGAAVQHAQERPELRSDVRGLLGSLCAALDERDGYTARHSDEVALLACAVGARLGLEPAVVAELEIAALLHDLGKMRVPMPLLQKPAALSPEEFAVMAKHPGWGAELLTPLPGLEAVASIVRYHHERWDGSGYPDGLGGSRIPLASRIIAACDAYHAMTSRRSYRPALGAAQAMCELWSGSGSQFDPDVVAHLAAVVAPPAVN